MVFWKCALQLVLQNKDRWILNKIKIKIILLEGNHLKGNVHNFDENDQRFNWK